MPQTTISGGYENPELVAIINELNEVADSLNTGEGGRIVAWLARQESLKATPLHILCAFAGGGANEMRMALSPEVERLVISDGALAAIDSAQTTLRKVARSYKASLATLRKKLRYEVLPFPLAVGQVTAAEYHAITCLGISFFHLEKAKDRIESLRQFYAMLKPGGHLFLDNKNWDQSLQEDRDPVTVYRLRPDSAGIRVLSATYEYPKVGKQIYHVQLMRKPKKEQARRNGYEKYKCEKRWKLIGYPVYTSTLMQEIQTAGFETLGVVDAREWGMPDEKGHCSWNIAPTGTQADYQLLIARKPETA